MSLVRAVDSGGSSGSSISQSVSIGGSSGSSISQSVSIGFQHFYSPRYLVAKRPQQYSDDQC